MTKKKRLLPLSQQFIIVLILFTISSIGIIASNAYEYIRLQTAFLDSSLEFYASQLARTAIEAYESYENVCFSAAYSHTVQEYLTSKDRTEKYEKYRQLWNQLNNTSLLSPYIVDIAVFGQDGTFASLTSTAPDYQSFADDLTGSRFSFCAAGTATINFTLCHILAMPIYSLDAGEISQLGILFLAVDVNHLLNSSVSQTESDYDPQILFTDSHGNLVYGSERLYREIGHTSERTSGPYVTDHTSSINYAVQKYSISNIDYSLYVLVDRGYTTGQVARISLRLLLGIGASLALVLFLLLLLYRPLINSLKQLTDHMKSISAGDRRSYRNGVNIQQGFLGSTEIDEISTAFNDMLKQTDLLNHTIFNTYTKMYELENNNRKTEIAFLRSQINPHFLYNTLTMICGMASAGMNDKIISVTNALSHIFRYSIKGSDMATLTEEMDIVRSYLMIQEERFGNRFRVRYQFSEDSYDCLIPKMIIQPLVENAIVHGLEKSLKPGTLRIGAGRNPQHGYLAIWIFDTGVGMPASKLEELRAAINGAASYQTGDATADLADMDAQHHDSIGILNVNSRMTLYYGTNYSLLIDSEEGVGTNIQIRVPYRTKQEDDSEPVFKGEEENNNVPSDHN